jgi:hypothetical protein
MQGTLGKLIIGLFGSCRVVQECRSKLGVYGVFFDDLLCGITKTNETMKVRQVQKELRQAHLQ